jgi:hypothetical protein
MPDALPIPADLIDLQRALDAARAELHQFVAETEAARRAEYPDPEHVVERGSWPDDLRARLAELRAAQASAFDAVRTHPVMQQALDEGCHYATELALKAAARTVDA